MLSSSLEKLTKRQVLFSVCIERYIIQFRALEAIMGFGTGSALLNSGSESFLIFVKITNNGYKQDFS